MSVGIASASFSKHCALHGSYFRELMVIFWLWPPDEKNWLTGKDPDAGKQRDYLDATHPAEQPGRPGDLKAKHLHWCPRDVGPAQSPSPQLLQTQQLACCSPPP